MAFTKPALSDSASTHDVYYGTGRQALRYIAYLDQGLWYHRVKIKGQIEYWPFEIQHEVYPTLPF